MNERAQSNQVGIIFMVALAVIAAAALGVFALDLAGDNQNASQAERGVTFEYDQSAGELTVKYTAGPETDKSELFLRGEDSDGAALGSWETLDGSGTVKPGDSFTVPVDGTEKLRVVYEGDGTTKVIQMWDGPNR